ncbi:hypothetical protein OROHE_006052 [Orobanche hederae]
MDTGSVQIGTGFSDALPEERSASLGSKVIPRPKSYFRFSERLNPAVWFEPTEDTETSVSVRHLLKSLSLLQKLTISEIEKDPDCKERCGWGVVAAKSISKGYFVVEYVGEGFFIDVLLTVRGTVLPNISLGNRVRSEELSLELLQATQLAVIVLTSARFFDCSANERAKLVRRVAMPDVS